MAKLEQPRNETERRVAAAIGLAIWRSEVVPQDGWVRAARAAMAALDEEGAGEGG